MVGKFICPIEEGIRSCWNVFTNVTKEGAIESATLAGSRIVLP